MKLMWAVHPGAVAVLWERMYCLDRDTVGNAGEVASHSSGSHSCYSPCSADVATQAGEVEVWELKRRQIGFHQKSP
jgi:hypothetical protein